jgi:hypothetical protein
LRDLKNRKTEQQARGKKASAKLKVENRKREMQIYLSSFVVAVWLACWIWREASKIRRETLKAVESVSLIDIDFVVLGKPKERERLSSLRAWMALRLSEYDCLPTGRVSAVDREKPSGCSPSVNGQV